MANTRNESATRILRRRQVEAITGWARSTIYQGVAEGRFPRPIRLGGRSVGWLADEVEQWIQARIAESRPGGTKAQS
jgi:prophage regulatory protein